MGCEYADASSVGHVADAASVRVNLAYPVKRTNKSATALPVGVFDGGLALAFQWHSMYLLDQMMPDRLLNRRDAMPDESPRWPLPQLFRSTTCRPQP